MYAIAEGKILEWRETTPEPGENDPIEFTLQPAKPQLRVNVRKALENNRVIYQFYIASPNRLVNARNPLLPGAPYCRYCPVVSPTAPFDEARATELLVEPGANNTYITSFATLTDDECYKMRILATDGANDYYEDIVFGPKIEAKAKKDVTAELAEGGQIEIDTTGGDNTRIGLDAGAITPSGVTETTIQSSGEEIPIGGFLSSLPNFQLSRTQSQRSVAMQKLVESIVASDVYEINLDSAQINKALTLTLNYDRSKVGEDEIGGLRMCRYNSASGEWEVLPGIPVVDPLSGTVSIDIDSIGGSRRMQAPRAKFDGKRFSINRAAPVSQSGVYAVFTQDPATVKVFSGTQFSIENFPNPFNLKEKNIHMTDVNAQPDQRIKGTMLKYKLPAGTNGALTFSIYNLAGELVKTLDAGNKTGGYYYYTEWDGRNDAGDLCASGVYLLIAECNGKKLNNKPHTMAILK
jgi:hypothetical protein